MHRMTSWILCLGIVSLSRGLLPEIQAAQPPNIIYLMADELGYYEPGFMGGKNIQTPRLDTMAGQGKVFRNLFAGSSVCAPTRCCFLTGKHSGHTSVRANGGGTPLRAEEETIASMLKQKGYATGGFGKWGCGGRDSTGVPEKHGFDVFLGYYDQVHAHSYYPPYLIRNSEEVVLDGNKGGSDGKTYSHYVIHQAAMQFIRDHAREPFFAYLPYTPPHGIFDIPDEDPAWALYEDQPWPEQARRYAAMVTMVDRQMGEILDLLKELGIAENTLVFFSGDNGGADYFSSRELPRGVHGANVHPVTGVEYRGKKGNLYEGGLRIPFVAYWPGHIAPGGVSDHLGYFPDILPTVAEVTGTRAPAGIDGLSLLPELVGSRAAGHTQAQHPYLYWEISGWTAIREGSWRAVKPARATEWELYDLAKDPSESVNVASAHGEVLKRLVAHAEAAHEPVREGTFSSTERHERDRRAKMGRHDQAEPAPAGKRKNSAKAYSMPTEGMIPNKGWKLVRFSSENASNRKFARQAIDGDVTTLWHSQFSGQLAPPPHELVIDLGREQNLRGVVYLGRQDTGWNGALQDIEVCVSQSPDAFGKPVLKAKLPKVKEPISLEFESVRGRYVLFRGLTEHGGQSLGSAAEIGFLGGD